MIEREIKIIVSKEEFTKYENMLESLITPRRKLQINYYFDTEDLKMYNEGNTLRIRQYENVLKLQYKYDKQYTKIERRCKEYEKNISEFKSQISSKDFLDENPHQNLFFYIGNMVTERKDYEYNDVVISLDKNLYLGKCDYELEIEFDSYENIKEILKVLSIKRLPTQQLDGKYRRFVKEYLKITRAKQQVN